MDDDLSYFYEDAIDQLQFMENALLDAKDGTNNQDIVAEIFRAMHTIKGNSGMFGFSDIVELTHKAENLLDEIRDNKVVLTANLSKLFMDVKDVTSILVETKINNTTIENDTKNMLEYLKKELLENMSNTLQENSPNNDIQKIENNKDKSEKLWHISLRFEPDFLKSGMDILSILKYFLKDGEILSNLPITNSIPLLNELDPISAYAGFEIDYQSTNSYDDIIEVFEFVEDDVDLFVFEHQNKDKFEELFQKREEYLKDLLIENFLYEEDVIETTKEEVVIVKKEEDKNEINPVKILPKINIKKDSEFFLKVNSGKIDDLINKVSQMVIRNAQIQRYAQNKDDEILEDMTQDMESLLEEVRNNVLNIRMVQVKDSFIKYRRIVNDTATKLNKEIEFILEGENTELDKSVVEKLSDPLTHMIRNAVDHGVEMPDVRISKGKNAKGKIILRAYPDAGTIIIELEDDGAGINKEAVLKKAIKNKIVSSEDNLSDKEIYKLIFSAGLSTASEISDISGRGVGMDVVKRNIEDLRGIIDVSSQDNKGSKISIRLPLTLAIIDGFLVQCGHSKFIIPVEAISQCIELTHEYKSKIKGSNTINIRNKVLPLLNMRRFYNDKITPDELKIDEDEDEYRQNVVIVKYSSYEVGLLVDELYGQQQVVIKSFGEIFKNIPGISGGTILGNNEIALILDIPKLIENQIKKGE
jgi:two-component system chemotaxis sensor kinase CheA